MIRKYCIFPIAIFVFISGCRTSTVSNQLAREYGEYSKQEFRHLGIEIMIVKPRPEIVVTGDGNVVIRANQLPDMDAGVGHMLFIGLGRVDHEKMEAMWDRASDKKSSHAQWLAERHETLSIHKSPWILSLRRDVKLADGSWIYVSAMIHAYDLDGEPHIVPEDVEVAKKMIESIREL